MFFLALMILINPTKGVRKMFIIRAPKKLILFPKEKKDIITEITKYAKM